MPFWMILIVVVIFCMLQIISTRSKNAGIKYFLLSIAAAGWLFSLMLYASGWFAHSPSVRAENQYFAAFLSFLFGSGLTGCLLGLLIRKQETPDRKKSQILYIIPALFVLSFYLPLVLLIDFGSVTPWSFITLILISAALLYKNQWWGCIFGSIVGIQIIYMSTQDTGQIINEMPIGIAVLTYHLICGLICYKKANPYKNSSF